MFHVPLLFVDLFVVAQVLVRSLRLLYGDYGGLTFQLRSELVCRPVPFASALDWTPIGCTVTIHSWKEKKSIFAW